MDANVNAASAQSPISENQSHISARSQLPKLPQVSFAVFLFEVFIIGIAVLYATSAFSDFDPTKRLGGIEAEYLTRTAYPVWDAIHTQGSIPLWDPYMELGDPLLTNPVSFYFNPFLSVPSILFGPYNGIKISIILSTFIVGLGGWALARILGLGPLARLLLALLLIGKGNMYSYLSQGHFGLFAAQAYFPWVFTGTIGILQGRTRWPVPLTAISFALVFFCGSPWYPPALLLSMMVLTAIYAVSIRPGDGVKWWRRIDIAWGKVAKVAFAFILTLCLAAATVVTLWNTRNKIGASSIFWDYRANLGMVIDQYFSGVKEINSPPDKYPEGNAFAFYSFVSPYWFALLLGGLIALVFLQRRKFPKPPGRLILSSVFLFIFCTLWGAGLNPIIELFYVTIPLANQFRHVERVLALSSVWLVVLIALAVDWLWVYWVRQMAWLNTRWQWHHQRIVKLGLRVSLAIVFIIVSGAASLAVIDKWHESWGGNFIRHEDAWEDYCVTWLRQTYPDQSLSIWTLSYRNIYTYYRNRVRHGFVGSDFYHAAPMDSTLFAGNLLPRSDGPLELFPQFAIGLPFHFDSNWLTAHGYTAIPESANPYQDDKGPCLFQREGAYPYAFWTTRTELESYVDVLPPTVPKKITAVVRNYDRIIVTAQAQMDEDVVVILRELAFPGWTVRVDGNTMPVESVGGLLGVVLPRDSREHQVLFQYLPGEFYIASCITLLTAVLCIVFLLFAQHLNPEAWFRNAVTQFLDAWDMRSDVPSVRAENAVNENKPDGLNDGK